MENTPIISLKDVTVSFPIYSFKARSFRNYVVSKSTGGRLVKSAGTPDMVVGLDSVSLDFFAGDRVGLIGHNGSGKTTLLKTIGGIYSHSSGSLTVNGTAECVIQLGLGMNDDASGYENIELVCLSRGMIGKELQKHYDCVLAFSDLGDFAHMPLRTYSAGMRLRLAFAIATMTNPSIFLIDEVFGVGDANFKLRAKERIEDLLKDTNVLIFASHDNDLIRQFCNKVIWLDKGKIKFVGNVEEGLERYRLGLTPSTDDKAVNQPG